MTYKWPTSYNLCIIHKTCDLVIIITITTYSSLMSLSFTNSHDISYMNFNLRQHGKSKLTLEVTQKCQHYHPSHLCALRENTNKRGRPHCQKLDSVPVGCVLPACISVAATRCQYQSRAGRSSNEQVWTGLQWWPPDGTRIDISQVPWCMWRTNLLHPNWTDEICEIITFPQLPMRAVKSKHQCKTLMPLKCARFAVLNILAARIKERSVYHIGLHEFSFLKQCR